MVPKEFINQVIKTLIKPAFKREGFAADRTTLRKVEDGFVKICNLQHSTFNTSISASFCMNVGLYFPAAYGVLSPSWLELEKLLPQKAKVEHCQFDFRATDLTNRPQSLLVDWQTDATQFEEEVQKEIAEVLTWFASMKKVEDCLVAQKEVQLPGLRCDLYVALTCAEQGNIPRATELVKAYISQFNGPVNTLTKILTEVKKRGIQA